MGHLPLPVLDNLMSELQKCRQKKTGHLPHAKLLLSYMEAHRLSSHRVLGNYLVPMLVDCGCLPEAQNVFDRLPYRNEHSWTSLISGYVDNGNIQQAFVLYHNMQEDGSAFPSHFTFLALLRASASMQDGEEGPRLHADIIAHGLEGDVFLGSTLVDMYAKCGSLAEAQKIFYQLPARNAVTWTALLFGYVEHDLGEEALVFFDQMQLDSITPDDVTFTCVLKACGIAGASEKGRELHTEIAKRGFESDLSVGSTLVDMYGKRGLLEEAHHVFEKVSVRDTVIWAALIAAYVEQGFGKEALNCFMQMQLEWVCPDALTYVCGLAACGTIDALERGRRKHADLILRGLEKELYVANALVDMYAKCRSLAEARKVCEDLAVRDRVAWAGLILGYAEVELDKEVLGCYEQMHGNGVSIDAATSARCLKACGALAAVELGLAIHVEISKFGLERDPCVGNSLVDMYMECGLLMEGRGVFDMLPFRDIVSWNTIITGYGENHEIEMALRCFKDLLKEGVMPDSITFTCLLVACSHASLVLRGQEYFEVMKEHKVQPAIDHCACMVDLLARSGQFHEAEKFAEVMSYLPCREILRALLSSCSFYGKVELGERCFRNLVQMTRGEAVPYLLMADIYASVNNWSDACVVETMRKHAGANKKPASASIEVNKKLNEFVASGFQNKGLGAMFEALISRLKNDGYFPTLDTV